LLEDVTVNTGEGACRWEGSKRLGGGCAVSDFPE